ncbi:MAG: ABC transporter permease [Myxococcales bacterium]|nr:ABC transporter permease [Myxococcales bacterium]
MRRYLRLFFVQLRTSLTTGMQYRWEFLIDGLMALFWAAMALLPLWVLAGTGREVEGWTHPEMIVVLGWFVVLKGLLDGAVNPSLMAVVEHIRKGTLDFVLLKPADAQFLVSTARFDPWKMVDLPAGGAILVYAFSLLGRAPDAAHIAAALLLLVAASLVLYSLWILVVSAAFFVVRLDNLAFLFMSIYDFARWPVSIFKGAMRLVFTFVIPLAIMTTYPARALLGKLAPAVVAVVFLGAIGFMIVARLVWVRAIGRYTSASS